MPFFCKCETIRTPVFGWNVFSGAEGKKKNKKKKRRKKDFCFLIQCIFCRHGEEGLCLNFVISVDVENKRSSCFGSSVITVNVENVILLFLIHSWLIIMPCVCSCGRLKKIKTLVLGSQYADLYSPVSASSSVYFHVVATKFSCFLQFSFNQRVMHKCALSLFSRCISEALHMYS